MPERRVWDVGSRGGSEVRDELREPYAFAESPVPVRCPICGRFTDEDPFDREGAICESCVEKVADWGWAEEPIEPEVDERLDLMDLVQLSIMTEADALRSAPLRTSA